MRNKPFRIGALRTLNRLVGACSRLLGLEIRGNDPSLLLRREPADEGRLRPVLISVGSRRQRT